METGLYPLKFLPLMKEKIWGGDKIKNIYGIDFSPLNNCGELWLLSGIEDNETMVENGFLAETPLSEVIAMYMDELLGEKNYEEFGEDFPLLIKIIDAREFLSVQVHPDDKYAKQIGQENGKSEMWYVLDAEEGSEIISGFNKRLTQAEFVNRIRDKNLKEVLNSEKAEKGDLFYIPAGRIHAIGSGVMLAEIQQSSDTTFRVYDWDRKDSKGNERELHIPQAMDVMDFNYVGPSAKSGYDYSLNKTVEMVDSPYFTTNLIHCTEAITKDYSLLDSFVIYFCTEGSGFIHSLGHRIPINMGEVMLIPAIATETSIEPNGIIKILETYIK
ncbi:MAG: mannose-6-phosphate isomerase [Bacteroidales bacterium]|nr:mannose-6-phosphate isomerase [Bacteroidales bacterium]